MHNESSNTPNSKHFSPFPDLCTPMFSFNPVFPIKALVFNNQDSLLKLNCPCNLRRANKSFPNFENSLI